MPKSAIRTPKIKLFIDVCYFLSYGLLLLLTFSGAVVVLIMILGMFNAKLINELNLSIPLPFSLTDPGTISWPDGKDSEVSLSQAMGDLSIQSIAKTQFFIYFGFRLIGIVFGAVSVWFVVQIINSVRNGTFDLSKSFKRIQWVAGLGMAAYIFEKIVIIQQANRIAEMIQYNGVDVQTSWGFLFQNVGIFFLWLFVLVIAEILKQGYQLYIVNNKS